MNEKSDPKFYVDCYSSFISQYPVVRTNDKIVARNFKGIMYEDAEARAEKLAIILNGRCHD